MVRRTMESIKLNNWKEVTQYIDNGFEDFNAFDIELLTILRDTIEDPLWENAGNALQDFSEWAANASVSRDLEWEYDWDSEEEDTSSEGGGDDGSGDDNGDSDRHQYVIFDDLNTILTFELNKYILYFGFEMRLQ